MNKKNMSKALNAKLSNWIASIDDKAVARLVEENAMVTGGAIVSMLQGEEPNDYDIYFKTQEAVVAVAKYYVNQFKKTHRNGPKISIKIDKERVACLVQSRGVATAYDLQPVDDLTEPDIEAQAENIEKPKYHVRYISTNAISLSDRIQVVIRYYGPIDEIHANYDFIHCTCSFDYLTKEVNLPAKALEAIINHELIYAGSRYPLCSIIRTRKFITRGWTINAGQYLKMCLQLNALDLLDLEVLADQLVGVDSAYFEAAITAVRNRMSADETFKIDNTYLFEIINRIF
jgi:hypothetical protein